MYKTAVREPACGCNVDCAAISVSDTGVGIESDVVNMVFKEGYTTKVNGSGVGLPFVRAVAEMHGGWADLSSSKKTGTEIVIFIPQK